MPAFYQSPFLLALGWAIAASLWQCGVLWIVYQLITSKKLTPAIRHNLALLLVLTGFIWFGITLAAKYQYLNQQVLNGSLSTATFLQRNSYTNAENRWMISANIISWLNQLLPYISAAYLLTLVLLGVRLTNAYAHSQQIKTRGLVALDLHWVGLTEKYSRWLQLKKDVKIYLSELIDVPATLNFFKPIILLPVAVFNNLSPRQVESVILHELAHIKRNDYLINIVIAIIETLLFFNPFIYLLNRSLRKEREHCCDDMVLHFQFDPHSYASALLYLEKLRVNPMPVTAIAATGSNYQLLGRVKRIMNVGATPFNYGQRLLALLITACILISIAWLSPDNNNSGNLKEEKPDVIQLQEPDDNMLAATLLSAGTTKDAAAHNKQQHQTIAYPDSMRQLPPPPALPKKEDDISTPEFSDEAAAHARLQLAPTINVDQPPTPPLPPTYPLAPVEPDGIVATEETELLPLLAHWDQLNLTENTEAIKRNIISMIAAEERNRDSRKLEEQKKEIFNLQIKLQHKFKELQLESQKLSLHIQQKLGSTHPVMEIKGQKALKQFDIMLRDINDQLQQRSRKSDSTATRQKNNQQRKKAIWVNAIQQRQPEQSSTKNSQYSLSFHYSTDVANTAQSTSEQQHHFATAIVSDPQPAASTSIATFQTTQEPVTTIRSGTATITTTNKTVKLRTVEL